MRSLGAALLFFLMLLSVGLVLPGRRAPTAPDRPVLRSAGDYLAGEPRAAWRGAAALRVQQAMPAGKRIYEAECASCHQSDGQGVPGAFPPLDGAGWVTGEKGQLIRILLHGLSGTVRVQGSLYNGLMPAWGAVLSDEEIAEVTTYVRTSWSNDASAISAEEVARVRRATEERQAMWTAVELKSGGERGAASAAEEKAARAAPRHPYSMAPPIMYRTFMPESSPASIAVGLERGLSYCFDTAPVMLRYAWKGGFVDNSEVFKGHVANQRARLVGEVFYRNQAGFPLRVGEGKKKPKVAFIGYRMVDGRPEFAYTVDGAEVRELITPAPSGTGLARRFQIDGLDQPLRLRGPFNPQGRPGRMYSAVPYRGWVMQYNPQTDSLAPFASGFRSPNGLVFDVEGRLFVTDNQGDWLGTSKLYHVRRGGFYGHPQSLVWEEGMSEEMQPLDLPVSVLGKMRTKAAVLFPQGLLSNSPTQPVIDTTGGQFGSFEGQMLIGEMNFPRILRVMLEEVEGALQGAVVTLIDSTTAHTTQPLRIGNSRMAFAPDGSLWVGQTDHGWAGDEGLQRIRWTGQVPVEVFSMHLTDNGFELTFTRPLRAATARADSAYQFARYYYEYHQAYGSERMDVQPVDVAAAEVSSDRHRMSLTLPELKAGYVYQLDLNGLQAEDGTDLAHGALYYTLNRLRAGSGARKKTKTTL